MFWNSITSWNFPLQGSKHVSANLILFCKTNQFLLHLNCYYWTLWVRGRLKHSVIPETASTMWRLFAASSQNWRNLAVCKKKCALIQLITELKENFQQTQHGIPLSSEREQLVSWIALPFAEKWNKKIIMRKKG